MVAAQGPSSSTFFGRHTKIWRRLGVSRGTLAAKGPSIWTLSRLMRPTPVSPREAASGCRAAPPPSVAAALRSANATVIVAGPAFAANRTSRSLSAYRSYSAGSTRTPEATFSWGRNSLHRGSSEPTQSPPIANSLIRLPSSLTSISSRSVRPLMTFCAYARCRLSLSEYSPSSGNVC